MCGEKEKSKIEALQEYMNAVHKQALKKKKKNKRREILSRAEVQNSLSAISSHLILESKIF